LRPMNAGQKASFSPGHAFPSNKTPRWPSWISDCYRKVRKKILSFAAVGFAFETLSTKSPNGVVVVGPADYSSSRQLFYILLSGDLSL
jgi:hypothetical protein